MDYEEEKLTLNTLDAIAGLVSKHTDAAVSHILQSLEVYYLYAGNNFLFR